MLKNYFIVAFRQFSKQKMYSFIKIGGFALSIAACMLITLYIRDELSYDKSYPDGNRIFRVIEDYNDNGKIESGADWPAPMAKAMKADFPEVEKSGRLMPHELFYCAGSNEVRRSDEVQNTYEEGFSFADQEMLDILKIPMVYGDRSKALAEPKSMVISKRIADKYFAHENPMGKILVLNNDKTREYKIGGVMQGFPSNSHIHYDFLLSLTDYQLWNDEQTNWMASNYYTYVMLKPGVNVQQLQDKMRLILTKYYLPIMRASGDVEADKLLQNAKFELQPVRDIHLKSYDIEDDLRHGDIRFIWLFGAIACFILIIACINFINLATAKSSNRAKEVGLRKVVGSLRVSLIQQFLTESVLLSAFSFLLGLLIAWISLPYFNAMAAKSLYIPWSQWWIYPILAGSTLIVGILAGLYPSFYLSAFKPISVLKGQVSRGARNSVLRNGLVIFQFATSIILIISTFIIYSQTKYILNKKVGYDKDHVILIQGTNTLGDEATNFKNELSKLPQIKDVTISDFLPISGTKRNGNTFWKSGKTREESGIFAQSWTVDEDYIKTLGIKLVEGRNFSSQIKSDSLAVIINQTMAKKMNLNNPVGKKITNRWADFTIVGVIEDFNFQSLHDQIGSMCFHLGVSNSIISARIKAGDVNNTIASITSVWKKFSPSQPIRYTFLDESFARMHEDVSRMGKIFSSFATLSIIIACLGLFALSAFMAEQRTKEIGIRKVLGATVSGITTMLSKDFLKLVFISIAIASPIAWWAMNKWLQDFAYRITISWEIFLYAGMLVLLVAMITISFQSIKAALMNPVKNLRAE
ncbi:MAG: hypothetical protein C5B59_09410 [Bacteroidetes bacterium]|nr:MAG: hypothetical protein C5B59_09410 [Bacteroidota bacterium]